MATLDFDLSDPVFDGLRPNPSFDNRDNPELAARRRFLDICRESFAEFQHRIGGQSLENFRDWVIYKCLLIPLEPTYVHGKSHVVDPILGKDFDFGDDGRIRSIKLSRGRRSKPICECIGRLEKLYSLQLVCITHIPLQTLSCMPRLEVVEIDLSSRDFDFDLHPDSFRSVPARSNFLGWTKLRRLGFSGHEAPIEFPRWKELRLRGSATLFPILHGCVALETLVVFYATFTEIDAILDLLSSPKCPFTETLTTLICRTRHCPMNKRQLETLVFQVLPRFPNLEKVHFDHISSVKVIADRIRSGVPCSISKALRCVNFWGNIYQNDDWRGIRRDRTISMEDELMMEKIQMDPDMKPAILTFLKTFYTVDDISCGLQNRRLLYTITTNFVGRRLLEEGNRAMGSLPLSIWPVIFHRAHQQRRTWATAETRANGIYYLLREGPALIGRRDLVSSTTTTIDLPPMPSEFQCCQMENSVLVVGQHDWEFFDEPCMYLICTCFRCLVNFMKLCCQWIHSLAIIKINSY